MYHSCSPLLQDDPRVEPRIWTECVILNTKTGWPLGPICPYKAKVELFEQAWSVRSDDVCDLAKLPSILLPPHVDGTADDGQIIKCGNLEGKTWV